MSYNAPAASMFGRGSSLSATRTARIVFSICPGDLTPQDVRLNANSRATLEPCQNSFVFLTLPVRGRPFVSHSYWGSIRGLEFTAASVPPHQHHLFSVD